MEVHYKKISFQRHQPCVHRFSSFLALQTAALTDSENMAVFSCQFIVI
jgi:hypothetical protein